LFRFSLVHLNSSSNFNSSHSTHIPILYNRQLERTDQENGVKLHQR